MQSKTSLFLLQIGSEKHSISTVVLWHRVQAASSSLHRPVMGQTETLSRLCIVANCEHILCNEPFIIITFEHL